MQKSKFNEVMLGDTFWFSGTLYRKKSSRTAWINGLSKWFYFGLNETVSIPERY